MRVLYVHQNFKNSRNVNSPKGPKGLRSWRSLNFLTVVSFMLGLLQVGYYILHDNGASLLRTPGQSCFDIFVKKSKRALSTGTPQQRPLRFAKEEECGK